MKRLIRSPSFWILCAMFAGLFAFAITHAMTPFSQTGATISSGSGINQYPWQIELGTGLSGNLSSIDVRFDSTTDLKTFYIIEFDNQTAYNTNVITSGQGAGTVRVKGSACSFSTATSVNTDTNLSLACFGGGTITFNPAKWYVLLEDSTTTYLSNAVAGVATSTYSFPDYGFFFVAGNPEGFIASGNMFVYFKLNGVSGPNAVPWAASTTPSISLIFPTSTTADFSNWVVDVQNATSGIMGVAYNQTGVTTTIPYAFNADQAQFAIGVSNIPLRISKSNLLWLSPQTTQTWYATPYLIPTGTTTAIYGTKVQFNVGLFNPPGSTTTTDAAAPFNPLFGNISYPTSTTSTANMVLTCDSSSGFFQYSLCYLFQGLFMPSNTVLNIWSGLKTDLSTKPPFGYFSAFSTTLATIGNATSSPYSLPDLSGINFFQTTRGIMVAMMYVAFVFWVIHRVRFLEL